MNKTLIIETNKDNKFQAVEKLITRLCPRHEDMFSLELISGTIQGTDVFEIDKSQGKVVLRGNNSNAIAKGLGHYLKYLCHINISWYAFNKIQVPEKLPLPKTKIRKECLFQKRFFLNYCTFGYTMPYWKWNDWERAIDWMAINGINMPLAITGTEAVLQEMWSEFGFSKDEIRGFLPGPGHLPWYHMSMISKWNGPCPQSYIDYGKELQQKILKRERALGMKPVLPAFSGHVPHQLKQKFPNAKISELGTGWDMFPEENFTYFLDPYDPLFKKVQTKFMSKIREIYGTDHLYSIDPFNEVTPPSWEPSYLSKTGKTIYESMVANDSEAIWVQMGWLFYFDKNWTSKRMEALMKSVPKGKMIMLDYFSENVEIWRKSESFYDTPFIWCYLGNFGGKETMNGPLLDIKEKIKATRNENNEDVLYGIGSTLEGFGVNEVVYEYLFELAWSQDVDLNQWIKDYARKRVGGLKDVNYEKAWDILSTKLYVEGGVSWDGDPIFYSHPTLKDKHGNVNLSRHFKPEVVMNAWSYMMKANNNSINKDAFRYDLVNLVREYLNNISLPIRDKMAEAYEKENIDDFNKWAKLFLEIIEDQDLIMGTRPEFLLGKWLSNARAIGLSIEEKDLIEEDARNLITSWGASSIPLEEYSGRSWNGLLKDYYYVRWEMFITALRESLNKNIEVNFDQLSDSIKKFEQNWQYNNKSKYLEVPEGDTWLIAKRLHKKYIKN